MPAACQLKTPLADDALLLRACRSTEALSTLGEATLTLLSPSCDIVPDALLGKPVSLHMAWRDDSTRHLSGHVVRFAQGGFEGRHHVYTMTVRPWLWLLTRTSDCRIFQDKTVPDIVKTVFQDHPVADFEFKLFRSYRTWTYCVQYRESDFDFIARLLEHEGIYWYVQHGDGSHKLVLVDAASAHDPHPACGSLPFYGHAGGASQLPGGLEHVSQWSVARSLKSGKVVLADYDFERPSTKLLADQTQPRHYDLSDAEVFDYPGGYLQGADGKQYAEDRLDAIQSRFEVCHGSAHAQEVHVGRRLALSRHPREDQNADYLVTATTLQIEQPLHESAGGGGSAADAPPHRLVCDFTALRASQQYRPPRRTGKPQIPGPQTAVVTGPPGEELFTDAHGRIKVQFHWDRYGQRDEKSSCWVRVSQPWAGKGWGSVSIPRIGQEVVVDFMEGDPDQPLITGRVYNAEQAPPFGMPAAAMVSGIKSKTHKGQGFNELSMNDTAGKEMITIHGQHDMATTVLHDQTTTVNNNRTDSVVVDDSESVGNNQTASVGVHQTLHVGSNQTLTVGSNRSKTVGAEETVKIGSNQSTKVGVNRNLTVGSSDTVQVGSTQTIKVALLKTETIGAGYLLTVGAAMNHAVGAALLQEVGGAKIVGVGGLSSEKVGISKSVTAGTHIASTAGANLSNKAGAKYSAESGSTMSFKSGADYSVASSAKVAISAANELVLKCGSAEIVLKSSGDISINGAKLSVDGSGKIAITAGGEMVLKGSKINMN